MRGYYFLVAQLAFFCFASPAVALLYRDDADGEGADSNRVRAYDRALAWSSIFFLFFSQLSRPGHTDLQPPHAPSAGRRGGCAGRIRNSAVTSRQRRTDGEITLKHTRLRIFAHDPPSRQPLFSAASLIWAPFGGAGGVAHRGATLFCVSFRWLLGRTCVCSLATVHLITSTCGFAPHPPSSLGVPLFHQTSEHSCERRTLRPGLPSERSSQIYSERRFN